MSTDLNVCLLSSVRHPQERSLFEQVEFLINAHRMLGFSVSASLGHPEPSCPNILVGIHLADEEALAAAPRGSIIWNTEIMIEEDPLVDVLCCLSKTFKLWDSSYGNIARLAVRGVSAELCEPCLLEQQADLPQAEPDSDVVVWGPLEGSKALVVEELERRGIRVLKASGNVGPDWERERSRARLFLDVPSAGERVSTARLSTFLQKGIPVVAAWGDVALDAGWRDALKVVDVHGAADACIGLLADHALWEAQGRAGQAWLRRKSVVDLLAGLWGIAPRDNQPSPVAVGSSPAAAAPSPAETHYFAICHVDPVFVPPKGTTLVCTGNYQKESKFHLSRSKTGLDQRYEYFTGTAGTFMIAEILQSNEAKGFVNSMQYRKFISKRQLGSMSQTYQGMVLIPPRGDRLLEVAGAIEEVRDSYCFPCPIVVGEVFRQYTSAHPPEDFLRFALCAVELGVLIQKDLPDFFNYPILIPGGIEFGRFPVSIYLEIVTKMRAVCELFIQRYRPVAMGHPYQGRGISFCCERLGSWLLIRHLEQLKRRPFVRPEVVASIGKTGNIPLSEYESVFSCSEFFGFAHCVNTQGMS